MPRLIKDDELLFMYAKPGRGCTDTELAEHFEVGRDAIWKRRRDFREKLGIEFIETERGRYRIDDNTFVTNLRVSRAEALTLYVAARRLSRSTRLSRKLVQNALDKLALALVQPMTEKLVAAAAKSPEHPNAKQHETIVEALLEGWMSGNKIKIRYRGLKGEQAQNHIIQPYLIEPSPWSDSVYVIARSNAFEDPFPFKLERIERAFVTGESYEVDTEFTEETLFDYAWGIWNSDKEPQPVRLHFTTPIAVRRVQESVWHPRQETEIQPDGSLIWRADIAEPKEMLPWVRGWGEDVTVLEPDWLRDEIEKTTLSLVKRYQLTTGNKSLIHLPYAKTNPDNGNEIHLLLYHLIDVGKVALLMWNEVLTDSIRCRLAEMLNLKADDAGRFIAFLAALHDIGKAFPGYQKKYAPDWLLTDLKKAGLQLENRSGGKAYEEKFPHGTVSTWILKDLLHTTFNLDKRFAHQLSVAVGGHHGSWPAPGATRPLETESLAWDTLRRDLFWEVHAVFHPPNDVAQPASATDQNIFLTIVSGLVSVADWLGSRNKECFSFIEQAMPTRQYALRAAEKAKHSLTGLGWLGWQPAGQKQSFGDVFAYLNFKLPRDVQLEVINAAQNMLAPGLLILEAPTGIGKTETALYLADSWLQQNAGRGLYVAMPTQATSNQMYGRIGEFLYHRYPDTQINYHLVHGQAAWQDTFEKQIELQTVGDDTRTTAVQAESWFNPRKRTLLAPFGVGTVDQTFLSILQTRHFFVRLFGLSHKVVIFDEVHAYDTFMSTLFERLLTWLNAIGTSVIILSATLPAETRRKLVTAYSGQSLTQSGEYPSLTIAASDREPEFIELSKPESVTVQLSWDVAREPEAILEYLQTKLANGGCAAVICNTVRRAQDIYRALDEARRAGDLDIPEDDLILFHARFPPVWRNAIERKVLVKFGKPDKDRQSPHRPRRAIVVATQVIEQSLDLDFDLMLTDLAPVDLIIQRAGRLHRHERSSDERHGLPRRLVITEPAETDEDGLPKFDVDEYVYARYILLRSYYALKVQGNHATFPADTTTLLEQVYGELALLQGISVVEGEAIKSAEGKMNKEQRIAIRKAKRQLVLEPEEEDLLKQDIENLDEDNPEVHKTFRAQTRDIDAGISLICLHRKDGRTFIYTENGELEINTAEEVPFQHLKTLQQNIITTQNKTLFDYFLVQELPPAWQKQAALRHYRTVIFEEGCYTKIPNYVLKLNRTFGLELEKQEEV